MQSIELVLDFSLYIIWYGFFTLFIFDFLLGLFALMKQSFATPSVQVISSANSHNSQSTQLQLIEETENEQLPEGSIVPISKADEATIQYLEMTGCDINDFESIQEARKFLDDFASWTIEPPPTQATQLKPQSILPDPWIEPLDELLQVEGYKLAETLPKIEPFPALKLLPPSKRKMPKCKKGVNKSRKATSTPKLEVLSQPSTVSKAVKKNTSKQSGRKKFSPITESQVTRLSFNQVCIEFAEIGLALERYRSSHNCYQVVFGCNHRCRFKTLKEALDWLAIKKQSIQVLQSC